MQNDVQIKVENGFGRLRLDRPDALHALNTVMCADMLLALEEWATNSDIHAVIVDHMDGSRGFCAGGDIRMLAQSGATDGVEALEFFSTEYRLNTAIFNFPKPFIAFMDGVTMGGGVGISVHGDYRIATERTLFAMPETGIGLFPDVGGGWFLPRLNGELGTWLALTGARLKGADVVNAGIATHFVESDRLTELKSQLISLGSSIVSRERVDETLARFTSALSDASFSPHVELIDTCFAGPTAESILENLETSGSEWAGKQAKTLRTKSPRTVKVALRQVREGARFSTFEENMRMEYRIASRQVRSADFLEGVRAIIIDKDHSPAWNPVSLEAVPDELIDDIFAPLLDHHELSF